MFKLFKYATTVVGVDIEREFLTEYNIRFNRHFGNNS